VFAAVFEFFTNEADAVKVGSHGEFFVFGLRLPSRCAPLGEGLVVERECEDDVAAYLPRVERTVAVSGVEAAKFDGVVACEKRMQV
jgi:hypothetical protein